LTETIGVTTSINIIDIYQYDFYDVTLSSTSITATLNLDNTGINNSFSMEIMVKNPSSSPFPSFGFSGTGVLGNFTSPFTVSTSTLYLLKLFYNHQNTTFYIYKY
jgi:hypothetical protein